MKIKISKVQWQEIGEKAGWRKTAQSVPVPQVTDDTESPIDIVNDPRTDMKTLLEIANNPSTSIDVLSAIVRNSHISPSVKNAAFNNPTYKARRESLM